MTRRKTLLTALTTYALFALSPVNAEGDNGVTADVALTNGAAFDAVAIRAVTNGVMLMKGQYGTLQVPLKEVKSIVFPGGDPRASGVVFANGRFDGELVEMKNDVWRFRIATDRGEVTLNDSAQLRSINVARPETPEGAGALTRNVLEWTFENSPFDNVYWTFTIQRVSLTANQVVFHGVARSDEKYVTSYGCALACKATDDQGREYAEVWNDRQGVSGQEEPSPMRVRCPAPEADAMTITYYLRTGDHAKPKRDNTNDYCMGDEWRPLPTIAISALRAKL